MMRRTTRDEKIVNPGVYEVPDKVEEHMKVDRELIQMVIDGWEKFDLLALSKAVARFKEICNG